MVTIYQLEIFDADLFFVNTSRRLLVLTVLARWAWMLDSNNLLRTGNSS